MSIIDRLFDFLYHQSFLVASLWLTLGNIFAFFASIIAGHLIIERFKAQRITEAPPPVDIKEVLLAISTVILNAGVAIVGWLFWQAGYITVRPSHWWGSLGDVLVLLLAMDFGMYVTHWIAHHPWIYPYLHQTHHQYESPRPLSLFALNPFEVMGFGTLWIGLLMIYDSSGAGIMIFLTLNLIFGTLGHVGVEPLPRRWLNIPLLNYIGTSTFHAQHHQDRTHNFGFYTLIWDHLFGTISPQYKIKFGKASPERA